MLLNDVFKILKSSASPVSSFYPIPIVPFVIFTTGLLEGGVINFVSFLKITTLSFSFFAGINLWNHINDVEEDTLSGRNNIFIDEKLKIIGVIISIFFYSFSFILVIVWSKKVFYASLYMLILVILTWLYSDKIFLGKFIPRLKGNYTTELLTYSVSFPLFTIILWNLAYEISLKTYFLAFLLLSIGLWALFLKDIKDLSGDLNTGLNTIAVKLGPTTAIKYSFLFIFFFYINILYASLSGVISSFSASTLVFAIIPTYTLFKVQKSRMEFDPSLGKYFNLLAFSNLLTLTLIGFFNLLQIFLDYQLNSINP